MKKNTIISLLLLFLSINTYAGTSGNSIMGPWRLWRQANDNGDTIAYNSVDLVISNIADVETTVLISIITGKDSNNNTTYMVDTNGGRTSGFFTGEGDFAYYNESPDEGSIEITIKPSDTVRIRFALDSGLAEDFTVYGKIDWYNELNNPTALIANITNFHHATQAIIEINGGDPF